MNNSVHFSGASDEWATPQDFFDKLNAEFGFTVDVCATAGNAKCKLFYSLEDNGLARNWGQSKCWMNPPYSQLKAWMAKAADAAKHGATVVCLIPSRTDTKAWHEYLWDQESHSSRFRVSIRFIKGRLKFGGSKNSAPFPSAVVIFKPH